MKELKEALLSDSRIKLLSVTMSALLSVLTARIAHCQTDVPPSSLKGRLLELGVQGSDPFAPEQVAALANIVALEVSTAPVGTSTGGFTFTWDSNLGTFRRSAESFGPAFAERSLTIGKGKFGAGFNWLHASYDSLAGRDLKNGELRTAQFIDVSGIPFSYSTMKSNIRSDTVVGFASYGVTNDFEVAIAIPWVRISMDADITSVPTLDFGHLLLAQSSSAGLGDVALIGKYHLWHHKGGGLSAGLELRLPTGDTNGLRGLGVARTVVSAIWSQGGTISPHANVGFEVWSDGVPISTERDIAAKNQLKYAVGVEFTPHPRVTAAVDVIGRRLFGGGAFGFVSFEMPGIGTAQPFVGVPRGLSAVSLAPGIKWNVAGNVLVTGSVLGSLANDGLRATLIPVVGLDWAF
jgi:hypothetical protein